MPFKKINAKELIKRKTKDNPELKHEIEKANMEYQLIKNIVQIRKELGLTQSDVSELSGLTQQMVSRFETYNRLPTLTTLIKYIDSLGYKIELKKKSEKDKSEKVCV